KTQVVTASASITGVIWESSSEKAASAEAKSAPKTSRNAIVTITDQSNRLLAPGFVSPRRSVSRCRETHESARRVAIGAATRLKRIDRIDLPPTSASAVQPRAPSTQKVTSHQALRKVRTDNSARAATPQPS